jgi:hypothetical protein
MGQVTQLKPAAEKADQIRKLTAELEAARRALRQVAATTQAALDANNGYPPRAVG